MTVSLFEDVKLGGRRIDLNSDTSSLVQLDFNDAMSSFSVYRP